MSGLINEDVWFVFKHRHTFETETVDVLQRQVLKDKTT